MTAKGRAVGKPKHLFSRLYTTIQFAPFDHVVLCYGACQTASFFLTNAFEHFKLPCKVYSSFIVSPIMYLNA